MFFSFKWACMHPDSHFLPIPDGPSSLDYSKMKTPESTWTDPTAHELVQRHRIYSSPNMSHNLKPLLARRKRLFTTSGTQGQPSLNGIPSVAREHVESLHQNAVTTLLYGKNNVELSLVSLNHVFFEKQPPEVFYYMHNAVVQKSQRIYFSTKDRNSISILWKSDINWTYIVHEKLSRMCSECFMYVYVLFPKGKATKEYFTSIPFKKHKSRCKL